MMSLLGVRPHYGSGIVSARVFNEDFVSLRGLTAKIHAEDAFEFGFAPKTSLMMQYEAPIKVFSPSSYSRLPMFFGLGSPYKTGIGERAVFTEFREVPYRQGRELPLERGIPENQLAYDYRGALSFRRQMFEPIVKVPTKLGGMKPLWESIGNKPSTQTFTITPVEQPNLQITELMGRTSMGGGVPQNYGGLITRTVTRQTSPTQYRGASYYARISGLAEIDEEQFLTMPGQVSRLNLNTISILGTAQTQRQPTRTGIATFTVQRTTQTQRQTLQRIQRQQQRFLQNTSPVNLQGQASTQLPSLALLPVIGQTQRTTPSLAVETKTVIGQVPKIRVPTMPTVPTLPKFPRQPLPKFPVGSLGGGSGGASGRGSFGGQWYLKRHKIKTFDQMLKTVGVGLPKGAVRSLNRLDKSMQKMDKATSKIFKGFGVKQKRRKRK
jgi:hypothetical protein